LAVSLSAFAIKDGQSEIMLMIIVLYHDASHFSVEISRTGLNSLAEPIKWKDVRQEP